jgi:Zn-dependent membrane protease YugP
MLPVEVAAMDLAFILILVGLYLASHALVWALDRLGKPT